MDATDRRHPDLTSKPAPRAMLARTVRFSVNPSGAADGTNGFSGRPAMSGLARYYELTVTLAGEPDPVTGYLVGIQEIDSAARSGVIPAIDRACRDQPQTEPGALLPALFDLARDAMPAPLAKLEWALTPTYRVEASVNDHKAGRVLIRQSFDFAAAHRLHSPELSDAENRAVFGKCNNPAGHGHNYRLEACVAVPVAHADRFDLARMERAVLDAVIEPYDHKNLNTDTTEFDQAVGGVMPSVERIAMACHARLLAPIAALLPGAELVRVTVWETDRTSCTYPA